MRLTFLIVYVLGIFASDSYFEANKTPCALDRTGPPCPGIMSLIWPAVPFLRGGS